MVEEEAERGLDPDWFGIILEHWIADVGDTGILISTSCIQDAT
jgi:hypothetical protein